MYTREIEMFVREAPAFNDAAEELAKCDLLNFSSCLEQYRTARFNYKKALDNNPSSILTPIHLEGLNNTNQKYLEETLPNFIEQLEAEQKKLEKKLKNVATYLKTSYRELVNDKEMSSLLEEKWSEYDLRNKQLGEMLDKVSADVSFMWGDLKDKTSRFIQIRDAIRDQIKDLEKPLEEAIRFNQFKLPVKLLYSFIKHQRPEDFHFMMKHIGADKLIEELPVLFRKISNLDPIAFKDEDLTRAYTQIYTSKEVADALKRNHRIRVGIAVALFFVFTPFSLAFTIPWILNKRNETLIEKVTFQGDDYADLRALRHRESLINKKNGIFNSQYELKKVVTISDNGETAVWMRKEQAVRLKKWIEIKNKNPGTTHIIHLSDQSETFFKKSKEREGKKISNLDLQMWNRM